MKPRILAALSLLCALVLLGFLGLDSITPVTARIVRTFSGWVPWDFDHNLWRASAAFLHGQNPYPTTAWFPVVIAFFPLGRLTLSGASLLWLGLSLSAWLLTAWILGARRPLVLGLSLIAILLFPPTFTSLLLGQWDSLAVLLMVSAAVLSPHPGGALLLALALTKPQLTVLVLPGLAVSLWHYSKLALVRWLFALAASVLWLTLPLWIAYPGWPSAFWASEYPPSPWTWMQPSSFFMFQLWWGKAGLFLWGVLLVSVMGVNVWVWRGCPAKLAVAISLALTPLVSPYCWSWDFVLLLPLAVYLISRTRWSWVILPLLWIACWLFVIPLYAAPDGGNHLLWWIPPLFVTAMMGLLGKVFLIPVPLASPDRVNQAAPPRLDFDR